MNVVFPVVNFFFAIIDIGNISLEALKDHLRIIKNLADEQGISAGEAVILITFLNSTKRSATKRSAVLSIKYYKVAAYDSA